MLQVSLRKHAVARDGVPERNELQLLHASQVVRKAHKVKILPMPSPVGNTARQS